MLFAACSASDRRSTLRGVVIVARRRYFVTFVAIAGIAATWGVMMAFSWSASSASSRSRRGSR